MNILRIKKARPDAVVPTRAHSTDAGLDLSTIEDVTLAPGERKLIDTGIAIQLPPNSVGLVCPRSGLAAKHGITVVNAPGVIDFCYSGNLMVIALNTGGEAVTFKKGDRIAQLLVMPLVPSLETLVVEHLGETERGENGLGSTGA